jgi:hypothetical protein
LPGIFLLTTLLFILEGLSSGRFESDQDQSQTANAVSLLETTSPPDKNVSGIGQIFWGPSLATSFNPPSQDPRTPDIIVTPNVGVIYTTSKP